MPDAMAAAEKIAGQVEQLGLVDVGAMEVSREDNQRHRVAVYCNREVGGSRCPRRRGHGGRCKRRQPGTSTGDIA